MNYEYRILINYPPVKETKLSEVTRRQAQGTKLGRKLRREGEHPEFLVHRVPISVGVGGIPEGNRVKSSVYVSEKPDEGRATRRRVSSRILELGTMVSWGCVSVVCPGSGVTAAFAARGTLGFYDEHFGTHCAALRDSEAIGDAEQGPELAKKLARQDPVTELTCCLPTMPGWRNW